MSDLDLVDRNPADIDAPYPALIDHPTSDAEWTNRIMAEIANPSMLGATPDTDPMAGEIARLRAVDPPIRSLGDEMVLFAAGLASGGLLPVGIRALPFAGRFGQQGLASMRGLTAEAERKLAALARSFQDRLGRMPSGRELLDAIDPVQLAVEAIADGYADSAGKQPVDDQGWQPSDSLWAVDALGQAVIRPRQGFSRVATATAKDIEIGKLLRWIVTEAQERAGKEYDKLRGAGGRSFQTYTKRHLVDDDVYAGRTSGLFSPKINVERRSWANFPSANYHDAVLDRSSALYSAIRGREQQLIDYYRSKGISDNMLNGIHRWNPLRSYYMRNAERVFGRLRPGDIR